MTPEDVVRLRHEAHVHRASLERQGEVPTWDFPREEMESRREHAAWLDSLADRIEKHSLNNIPHVMMQGDVRPMRAKRLSDL